MEEILFERAVIGGYKPEGVDKFVDDSLARFAELETTIKSLNAQIENYKQTAERAEDLKLGYERRLTEIAAADERQKSEINLLNRRLAEAQKAAKEAAERVTQNSASQESLNAANEDLSAANDMIRALRDEIVKLSENNNSGELEQFKELLRAANAELELSQSTVAELKAKVAELTNSLAGLSQEGTPDNAMARFVGKFDKDFTEIFDKAQDIANRYIQDAQEEAAELKLRAEADMANVVAETNVKAMEIIKTAEERADDLLEQTRDECAQMETKVAEELRRAKQDGAAIVDGALYEAYKLEMESRISVNEAREDARQILDEAMSEADEITHNANEIAEATIKEANYKLQLAEDRAKTILARAKEKTEKNLQGAKEEYNKIRELTERTLKTYRRLNEQIQNMEAPAEE